MYSSGDQHIVTGEHEDREHFVHVFEAHLDPGRGYLMPTVRIPTLAALCSLKTPAFDERTPCAWFTLFEFLIHGSGFQCSCLILVDMAIIRSFAELRINNIDDSDFNVIMSLEKQPIRSLGIGPTLEETTLE
jgi:hypothetical protein